MTKNIFQKFRRKPQWIITYWCSKCRIDSGRTELDGPRCYACNDTKCLSEIGREPMSRQAIAKRLQISTDRMMENLKKAYNISAPELPEDVQQELHLLEALAVGKDLQKGVEKMIKKNLS